MKAFICLGLMVLFITFAIALELRHPKKIVCSWNSKILDRRMTNKLEINDLRPVLSHCTHLIYRYAGMNLENQEVILLYPNIDTGTAKFLPLLITHVKRNFPDLKVYLGIGGNDVPYEKTHEYRTFMNLGHGNFEDKNVREHRDGFTQLVRELRADPRLRLKNRMLTVLPNVNVPVYYAPRLLAPIIEAVHLMAFNLITLECDPEKTVSPASMYDSHDHDFLNSIDFQTRYWLENGTPGKKIVIGMPTRISSILYLMKKYRNHAYLFHNRTTNVGIWLIHENPDNFVIKELYVSGKSLGGIAIPDFSYDDFNGTCT